MNVSWDIRKLSEIWSHSLKKDRPTSYKIVNIRIPTLLMSIVETFPPKSRRPHQFPEHTEGMVPPHFRTTDCHPTRLIM